MEGVSRRAFLTSSAAVATGAAIGAAPVIAVEAGHKSAAAATEPPARIVEPSTPTPHEPVMAYVRDAQAGEVTVLAGINETTYHDPALVKRLLDAAPAHDELAAGGGGADVIAP